MSLTHLAGGSCPGRACGRSCKERTACSCLPPRRTDGIDLSKQAGKQAPVELVKQAKCGSETGETSKTSATSEESTEDSGGVCDDDEPDSA